MKSLDGGRRPSLFAARLMLCAILGAVLILGRPLPARADGLYTHTIVVEGAVAKLIELDNLDPQNDYSELVSILEDYGGYVNYGALFPDIAAAPQSVCWGGPDQGWSELFADTNDLRANWKVYGPIYVPHQQPTRPVPGFRAALMAQLRAQYKANPRSEEGKKSLAFLFGLISHQEADLSWHSFTENPNAMETKLPWGFDGPFGELRVDNLLVRYEGGHQVAFDYARAKKLVLAAVKELGSSLPDTLKPLSSSLPGNLDAGARCVEAGWSQANDYWLVCWPINCDEVKGLVQNHVPGGITDAAALTAVAWIETWDTMKAYAPVTTISLSPAQPEGNDGSYRGPVTIGLSATGTFLGRDTGPFEIGYSVNGDALKRYTGPFVISSEGIHEISAFSEDAMGVRTDVASETIIIAPKPPIDQPCPEPSPDCDPQPPPYYVVINGQQACLERDGSGCSPFVLAHPECKTCSTCNVDVETEVCKPYLTGKVPEGQTQTVYEMCQSGARWMSRVRLLDSLGNCPASGGWAEPQPPDTGVELPAPLIVSGLVILGTGFTVTGLALRRRKS